ncbi:MAG TPA: hypothetical protein VH880_07060 [Anaeromyxobacteraceae bacterium]
MPSPWIIEKLERARREREARERPALWRELPDVPARPPGREPRGEPRPTVVVIEIL